MHQWHIEIVFVIIKVVARNTMLTRQYDDSCCTEISQNFQTPLRQLARLFHHHHHHTLSLMINLSALTLDLQYHTHHFVFFFIFILLQLFNTYNYIPEHLGCDVASSHEPNICAAAGSVPKTLFPHQVYWKYPANTQPKVSSHTKPSQTLQFCPANIGMSS